VIYETKNILSEQARCAKCGGREFLDKDYYGYYAQCLQCGHLRNLDKVIEAPAKTHAAGMGSQRRDCTREAGLYGSAGNS